MKASLYSWRQRLLCPARLALGWGAAALLAACSILPDPTPVETYVLPGAQWPLATTSGAHATSPTLRITRPTGNGTLSGKRIIVMPQADRLQVYQGAVWSEPPTHMLRNRLLDAFLADGRLPQIDTDEGPATQVDFLLATQLRSFHSVYENGRPLAFIRMDAQIVNTSSNRAIASRSFEVRQPAAGKSVSDVVQALGQASDWVAQEMVHWVIPHIRHDNKQR